MERIQDKDYATNGISCESNIMDMYYNNNFLFLERGEGTLEIYDVSNPKNPILVKTYVHPSLGCYYESPSNCLTGNKNYTFVLVEGPSYITEAVFKSAIVAFDINSPELTHKKVDLPNSNYSICQFIADNNHLYIVREHLEFWNFDWQIEKYEIGNPFSLSLVSNTSVSDFKYLYVRENNIFLFNDGNINNWTIPYCSDDCYIKDTYYENNWIYLLVRGDSFTGLIVLEVLSSESFQLVDIYPADQYAHIVNLDVIENNIFVSTTRKIDVLNFINNNLEKISSYSFEYILGDLMIMCSSYSLLFVSKSSCCCRHFQAQKPEDKATLVIFNVENPSKIKAVYPRGFDNRYHLLSDGNFYVGIIIIAASIIGGIVIVSIAIALIIRKVRKQKKII
ncbi:MAG: hypothetical protein FK730_02490 [Asgard group archaeon]|nr:hypothetical protein [Asgard group archaeon]